MSVTNIISLSVNEIFMTWSGLSDIFVILSKQVGKIIFNLPLLAFCFNLQLFVCVVWLVNLVTWCRFCSLTGWLRHFKHENNKPWILQILGHGFDWINLCTAVCKFWGFTNNHHESQWLCETSWFSWLWWVLTDAQAQLVISSVKI